MKAVIMCGGAATRMRPITETTPKPLLKVAGIPVLDIIVSELLKNGIEELYITLGFMADEIIAHVNESTYSDNVTFVREERPLGTAGGVKNALGEIDEDIVAVCGDNLFSFDLTSIIDYHKKTGSDFTIVAVDGKDTSEYGVITVDDDGTIIGFSEKPLPGENDSQLINTGFYIVGRKVLPLIPNKSFYDFSNDLFPKIMTTDLKMYCCREEGYWGDIGDFESYIAVNGDMLSGTTGIEYRFNGQYFSTDAEYKGSKIIAPVLIDKTANIGTECVIGPFTCIGKGCSINDGAVLNTCICLDNSVIGLRSELTDCVICEEAVVGAYVNVERFCAFGEGAVIENYCKVEAGTRVWPRVHVPENTRVSQNIFCKPAISAFFMSSFSGTVFKEISCTDVLRLGQAVASVKGIKKIGIACDNKKISVLLARLFSCGVLASGGSVYNFGSSFSAQASFYASYCSLDFTVFISVDDSTASFVFSGQNGIPISASLLRKIRSICKFSGYSEISPSFISSEYEMSLISDVYSAMLVNEIKGNPSLEFCVVCSNEFLTETLEDVLEHCGCKKGMNGIRIFINDEGTRMYIQDGERVYSSEEILCACALREYKEGKSIVISEDSPEMLVLLAEQYGVHAHRIFSATDDEYDDATIEYYKNNRWIYDSLFLVCRFIGLMYIEKKSMNELMESVPRFSTKRFNIDFNINPSELSKTLNSVGAVKNRGDAFYRIDGQDSNARIRVANRAGRLKILVEAKDSEIAREFAREITSKINNGINHD